MRRATFPRNIKRMLKRASSAVAAIKSAAFLICPDGAAATPKILREALLPRRKSDPARKTAMTRRTAGSSFMGIV